MAVVGGVTVTPSEAIGIIESLHDNGFCFLRSRIAEIEFGSGKESLLSSGLWEMGRLFNKEYELRWRVEGEQYRMTVLTEAAELPAIPDGTCYEQIANGWDTDETKIMLWGSYESYSEDIEGFLEVRIPKFLKYPAPTTGPWSNKEQAVIYCVNYLKDGLVLYTRFKEIAKYVG